MTSAGWRTPSSVTTRVGLDAVDRRPDQLDVVARQRPQPAAVVLQRALAGGRIVRHHLGEQFGVVADLAGDPLGEHHAGDLVDLADRPLLVRVVRVDPRGVEALVAAGPEQQEPVPAAVERQVPQRPLHAGPDLGVVVRVGEHPLRGALEHREVLDVVGDGGRDLESAGARADHRDALAASGRPSGPTPRSGTPGPAKSACPGCRERGAG